jgi:DNA end-binding protein Ku
MAPRANWKGYLRLSLVSCPIALYPASSLSEKVSFNRLNRKTGNRLRQQNREDTARGYEVAKGQYLIVEDEELDAVQIESTRTIDIDQFVPKTEIDERYIDSPYYIAPDGQVGQDAFAVIRDTISKLNMVALGRVVLTRREHVIALEPKGRGLMGLTLRYPYEVRNEASYFEEIPDLKLPKEMLDLATHIVNTKSGHFDPSQFQDRYENALIELLKKKEAGEKIEPAREAVAPRVVNLMDALRASIDAEKKKAPAPSTEARRPAKKKASQK